MRFLFLSMCFIPQLISHQVGKDIHQVIQSNEKQIEEVLNVCFPGFPKEEISKILLVDGHSGDTLLLFACREQHYVLRLFDPLMSPFQLEMKVHMMQQTDQAGVGPHIVGLSKDKRVIAMEYVKGGTLTLEQSKNPQNRIKIAEAMRKMHSGEKNPYIQETLAERIKKVYHKFHEHVENKIGLEKALDLFLQASRTHAQFDFARVNIHGDLVPRNIFVGNDKAVFIDENLFFEDPFLDIAYFSVCLGFEDQEELDFLETYLQRPSSIEEQKRFLLAKIITTSRLCIICNCYSSVLAKQGDTIDASLPIKNDSSYASQLTSHNNLLPAQFFYDSARALLIKAEQLTTATLYE